MTSITSWITLTLCIVTGYWQAGFAGENNKGLSGWKFEQLSSIDGPFTLLVLDSAVKVTFPKRHFVYLCAAPSWIPVIFNLESKKKISFKSDYWSAFHVGDDTITTSSKPTIAKDSWQGKSTISIMRPLLVSDPLREKVEMIYRDGSGRSRAMKSEKLVIADWLKLKPQVVTFLRNYYRMRGLDNVLLKRIHVYTDGKNDVVLDTISCTPITVGPAELHYPIGYRDEKEMDIVTEETRRRKEAVGVFEDLFDVKQPAVGKRSSTDGQNNEHIAAQGRHLLQILPTFRPFNTL
jgi:hypothetical protein